MFCSHCGREGFGPWKFCRWCGNPFPAEPADTPRPAAAALVVSVGPTKGVVRRQRNPWEGRWMAVALALVIFLPVVAAMGIVSVVPNLAPKVEPGQSGEVNLVLGDFDTTERWYKVAESTIRLSLPGMLDNDVRIFSAPGGPFIVGAEIRLTSTVFRFADAKEAGSYYASTLRFVQGRYAYESPSTPSLGSQSTYYEVLESGGGYQRVVFQAHWFVVDIGMQTPLSKYPKVSLMGLAQSVEARVDRLGLG